MAEVLDKVDAVIEQVSSQLPSDFPMEIAESIFLGLKRVKQRCP